MLLKSMCLQHLERDIIPISKWNDFIRLTIQMHLRLMILKEHWLGSQMELAFNYFSSERPLATCSTILESIPTSIKWDYNLTSHGGWEA